MRRNSYVGSANVGGGAGGNDLGQIKWFANGETIPTGWEPCDGGGFIRPKSIQAALNAMAMDPTRIASRMRGSYLYRTQTQSLLPRPGNFSRSVFVYKNLVYWGYVTTSSDTGFTLRRAPAYGNPNFGQANEEGQQSVSTGAAVAFGMDTAGDGYILALMQDNKVYGIIPNWITGSAETPTLLGTASVQLVIPPVKFTNRWFSATASTLHRCAGAGSWSTWADVTPPTMGKVIDLVVGQIAGVETLAAFCVDGAVWVSTDGDSWTKKTNAVPNTMSAVGSGRAVYDGAGTWFVLTAAAFGGFRLYKSTDLDTWTGVTHPVTGTPNAISGAGGCVVIGGSGAVAAAHSGDGGVTWNEIVKSTDAGNAGFDCESAATDGGCVITFQPGFSGVFTTHVTTFETSQKRPKFYPVIKDGTTYNAYIKVK